MEERSTPFGLAVTVHRYQRRADSSWQVRIDIDKLSLSIENAVQFQHHIEQAIKCANQYKRDIERAKYEHITIDYLVEGGWIIRNLNTNGITVKGPNWLPVKPDGKDLPYSYAAFSVKKAYANIIEWAIDNGDPWDIDAKSPEPEVSE